MSEESTVQEGQELPNEIGSEERTALSAALGESTEDNELARMLETMGVPAPEGERAEPEKPEEEATEEEEPEEEATDELGDAELGRRLRASLSEDPVALMRELAGVLTDEQRAQLGLAAPDATPEGELKAITAPTTEEDAGVWEHDVSAMLSNMPKHIDAAVSAKLSESEGRIAVHVDSAAAHSVVVGAQLQALAEMIGMTLPAISVEDVTKAARAGGTWEEALAKVAGASVKKHVALAKQRAAKVPDTPASGGSGLPKFSPDHSLLDMARIITRSSGRIR
jgi:hypothetical protein